MACSVVPLSSITIFFSSMVMVNSTTLGRLWPPAHAGGLAAGDQGDLGAGQLVGVLGMRQAGGQRDDQAAASKVGRKTFMCNSCFRFLNSRSSRRFH